MVIWDCRKGISERLVISGCVNDRVHLAAWGSARWQLAMEVIFQNGGVSYSTIATPGLQGIISVPHVFCVNLGCRKDVPN
jgi:hypothetical protein